VHGSLKKFQHWIHISNLKYYREPLDPDVFKILSFSSYTSMATSAMITLKPFEPPLYPSARPTSIEKGKNCTVQD
jgi:hypothetical protein